RLRRRCSRLETGLHIWNQLGFASFFFQKFGTGQAHMCAKFERHRRIWRYSAGTNVYCIFLPSILLQFLSGAKNIQIGSEKTETRQHLRWRSGAHAHIHIFRSGDILAPSYGPESVLAATHPSNFKRIACAGLGAHPCRPNKHIWEHMGTCDTHKICFQGMGEVETVDNTPGV
ncbi:unnamed protein product, partial [Ectocarpus sp. 12 AP-2014]